MRIELHKKKNAAILGFGEKGFEMQFFHNYVTFYRSNLIGKRIQTIVVSSSLWKQPNSDFINNVNKDNFAGVSTVFEKGLKNPAKNQHGYVYNQ